MRRLLDAIYDGAGVLAALFMVGTLAMVLSSMLDRFIPMPLLRGMDAYAGYCMAGAGFLALAHTLRRGEHIRVTLLLHATRGPARRVLELACLAVAVVLSGAFAWYSIRLAWDSWRFHDISTGLDATPLWIPQTSMALGAVIFFISFVDECWMTLAGRRQQPVTTPTDILLNE